MSRDFDDAMQRINELINDCNEMIQKLTDETKGIKEEIQDINRNVGLPNNSKRGNKVLGNDKGSKGKRKTTQ